MQKFMTLKRLALVMMSLAVMAMLTTPAFAAEVAVEGGQANPLTPLGINGGLLIVHTFNFILVMALLTVLLWRPAVNMLDARAVKIQKGLEDAAAAAKSRQNAEADVARIMADARTEANKVVEEARGRADDVAKTITVEARSAADKIRVDAQADSLTARNAELSGLRERVVDISVAVAGRILGETIDARKQGELISNFFSNVPVDARNMGGRIEIVSAMPLNDAEQANARTALGASDVTFSVDPSILGGVVVRSENKVVDGSVRNSLNNLSNRLG